MAVRNRSQGALLLARVGATQEEIAARTGINRVKVSQFAGGKLKPGPKNRAKLKRHYGVPEPTWDVPAMLPPPVAEERNGAGDWSLQNRAERLQRMFDQLLAQMESDPQVTPYERTKLGRNATQMLAEIGKLTGETQEISEARLLRLPSWRRIRETISTALHPWPEAAMAVAQALKELGQ